MSSTHALNIHQINADIMCADRVYCGDYGAELPGLHFLVADWSTWCPEDQLQICLSLLSSPDPPQR